ncbi:MAG: hypothetical protein ACI9N1_001682 [Flavobacteriales bacterium]|jgi:hypothetical protein
MKNTLLYIGLVGTMALGVVSCERKYDQPPVETIPEGNIIDIATLKGMHTGTDLSIQDELSLYGVITTDETSGNFYKVAFIEDGTEAINMRLQSAGGLYVGDSVRVYLKGTVLTNYNGLLQLDSVDVDKNIIKQATNVAFAPTVYNMQNVTGALQSRLVTIENVEFSAADLGSTWADPVTQFSENKTLTDCNGNTILVRTSGYANFAGDMIPQGNGSITGVVSVFGSDVQLFIRTPSEVVFPGARCTGGGTVVCDPVNGFTETFTSFSSGNTVSDFCWETQATVGSISWLVNDASGNNYAVGSILGTSDSSNEMWMVSPEIQSAGTDALTFLSAKQGWNHDGLTVHYSTNYTGNAATATWTPLTATYATSTDVDDAWVGSGSVDLSAVSGMYHIGFKYAASGSGGMTTTYKVDNVTITQ